MESDSESTYSNRDYCLTSYLGPRRLPVGRISGLKQSIIRRLLLL